MDANAWMPGDFEARAAAGGMAELYGHGRTLGEELWFQPTVGSMPRPGRVVGLNDDGRLHVAEGDGTTHIIDLSQVAEF